jgi:hypothetical protein
MNWREGICTLLIITAGHDEQLFVSKKSAFNQTSINTQSKLRRSVRQLAAGHTYNHINKNMMFNQYALEEYAFAQQSRMPTSWRLVSSPFRQGSRCIAAKYRACAGSCMWKGKKCKRWRNDTKDACEVGECCMDCWSKVMKINQRKLKNYWDNLEDECRSNAPFRHLVMFLTFVCDHKYCHAMSPLRNKVCLQNNLTIFSYEPLSDHHVQMPPSMMLRQNAFIIVPYTTVGGVRPVSTSLRPWRYMGSFNARKGHRLKIRTDLAAYLRRPGHHHSGTNTCGGRSSVNESDNCTTATADFCLEPPGDTPTRSHFYWAISQGCLPVVFDFMHPQYRFATHWAWRDIANLSSFAVVVTDPNVSAAIERLLSMPVDEIIARKVRLASVQDLYVYKDSGRDAFQTAIDVFLNKSLPFA